MRALAKLVAAARDYPAIILSGLSRHCEEATPTAAWLVVAKLGGHAECAASMKRTPSVPPVQYLCLPEGDQPPRR